MKIGKTLKILPLLLIAGALSCAPAHALRYEIALSMTRARNVSAGFAEWTADAAFLRVANGDPGIRRFEVVVNGAAVERFTLRDGATALIDLAPHLVPGRSDFVVVHSDGKAGGTAALVLTDEA